MCDASDKRRGFSLGIFKVADVRLAWDIINNSLGKLTWFLSHFNPLQGKLLFFFFTILYWTSYTILCTKEKSLRISKFQKPQYFRSTQLPIPGNFWHDLIRRHQSEWFLLNLKTSSYRETKNGGRSRQTPFKSSLKYFNLLRSSFALNHVL